MSALSLRITRAMLLACLLLACLLLACLLLGGCHARSRDDAPMVSVPAGVFWMGPKDGRMPDYPREQVYLDSYYIDQHEVTLGQYARFVESAHYRPPFVDEEWAEPYNWKGGRPPEGFDDHPVTLVNWFDAAAYCQWAGKRLPTEAEWEKAAYGPAGTRYPWGDEWLEGACNDGRAEPPSYDDSDGYATTSPVGAFPRGRSVYGADDMLGNAWEWNADWHGIGTQDKVMGTMRDGILANPKGAPSGHTRAARGGSFFTDVRTGVERLAMLPEERRKTTGFRCARTTRP